MPSRILPTIPVVLRKLLLFVLLGSLPSWAARTPEWQKLEGCTFLPEKWADGDSFHILHDGQEVIIRLYFVDTPEDTADQRYPERIAEQAAYFGLTSEQVLKVGDAAAEFTARTLGAAPFTVYTCGQGAGGSSAQNRVYGVVETPQGNLAELLVRAGLARIYGKRITMLDGTDSRRYLDDLGRLERQAKAEKAGGWAKVQ